MLHESAMYLHHRRATGTTPGRGDAVGGAGRSSVMASAALPQMRPRVPYCSAVHACGIAQEGRLSWGRKGPGPEPRDGKKDSGGV